MDSISAEEYRRLKNRCEFKHWMISQNRVAMETHTSNVCPLSVWMTFVFFTDVPVMERLETDYQFTNNATLMEAIRAALVEIDQCYNHNLLDYLATKMWANVGGRRVCLSGTRLSELQRLQSFARRRPHRARRLSSHVYVYVPRLLFHLIHEQVTTIFVCTSTMMRYMWQRERLRELIF